MNTSVSRTDRPWIRAISRWYSANLRSTENPSFADARAWRESASPFFGKRDFRPLRNDRFPAVSTLRGTARFACGGRSARCNTRRTCGPPGKAAPCVERMFYLERTRAHGPDGGNHDKKDGYHHKGLHVDRRVLGEKHPWYGNEAERRIAHALKRPRGHAGRPYGRKDQRSRKQMAEKLHGQIKPVEQGQHARFLQKAVLEDIQNETGRKNQKRRLKTYEHVVVAVAHQREIRKREQREADGRIARDGGHGRPRVSFTPKAQMANPAQYRKNKRNGYQKEQQVGNARVAQRRTRPIFLKIARVEAPHGGNAAKRHERKHACKRQLHGKRSRNAQPRSENGFEEKRGGNGDDGRRKTPCLRQPAIQQ